MPPPKDIQHQVLNFTACVGGLLRHIEKSENTEDIIKYVSMIKHRCAGITLELIDKIQSTWIGGDNEHTE